MTTLATNFAGEFNADLTWNAIVALLTAQLPGVDVDAIGERDFDEQNELTVSLPAARVVFVGQEAQSRNAYNETYNATQTFGVIACAEDLSNTQQQRLSSIGLNNQVLHLLTGARLALADGSQTGPVAYMRTVTLPTVNSGMAYVSEFRVDFPAQFAAPNAYPTQEQS